MSSKLSNLHRFLKSAIAVTSVLLSVSLMVSAAGLNIKDRIFGEGGAVYVMTNQAAGNTVAVFDRAENGSLTPIGEAPTGGLGTGAGLGSQGALTMSGDGHLLFAVNAGSNTLSVLRVFGNSLRLADQVDSGGTLPISVTVHGFLVYVLNAGGTPNITGFFLSPFGKLFPIPNSTRPLAGGAAAGPAQVSFSPDGELLIVTEKGTGLIDVFSVGFTGRVAKQTTVTSNNSTPFGFNFQGSRVLVVSEAAGGAAGASTVSTYRIDDDRGAPLTTISASVPDTQTAACWIVVTGDRQLAFTTNTGSGTVSSFNLSPLGQLTLRQAVAADLGSGSAPVDMALSRTSNSLFVLSPGNGLVTSFQIQQGNLIHADSQSIPASSSGIAAR